MSWRLASLLTLISTIAWPAAAFAEGEGGETSLGAIKHIVVIYEENHSFDNLYGGWEGVNGRSNADTAHTRQVTQGGVPFTCLKQLDLNLTVPPLSATCTDSTTATTFTSHFSNAPFLIDNFIHPGDTTCPPTPLVAFSRPNGWLNGTGSAGGCTRDIVHRFYQEQFQLNGGQQNRYAIGSDAAGTVMGVYDTQALPIYKYLHAPGHPDYAILDDFFAAAFGGSFLEHQWLIAARTPDWPGIPATQHSIVDTNGFPNATYPLYTPTTSVRDAAGAVAVPPPGARPSRRLRSVHARRAGEPARAPQGRAGVHPARAGLGQAMPAEAGELHQAVRHGERTPRLRERAQRQRPPRPAVAIHRKQQVQQRHDGDRHLRRVRRSVGSRLPARSGGHAGAARPMGPGHADPGADPRE